MKFRVIATIDATISKVYEAESPEAAQLMFEEDNNLYFSVCHQCSDVVQIGDIMDVVEVNEED